MKTARTSRLAIVSLVVGILGVLFAQARAVFPLVLAFLLGLLAIIFGARALRLVRRAPEMFRGRTLAVNGIFLGIIYLLVSCGAFFWMKPQPPPRKYRSQQWASSPPVQAYRQRVPPPPPSLPVGRDNSLTNFHSNLPLVIIQTGGQYIFKEPGTIVTARFINVSNGVSIVNGPADYAGWVIMKAHGSSTLRLPKSSYNIHPIDEKTNKVKVALFGLPKDEDWVLYAPYEDKTMLRDVLAYELFTKMGRYAPRTQFVEVFLNTTGQPLSYSHYAGVYVLVEKIKRGKNRVNVEKLAPTANAEPDITGGYIFRRDHRERKEECFYTRAGGPYFFVYPKAKDITPAQKIWLVGYLNRFEAVLNESWFADPQKGYRAYLDIESFIDAHWLVELSKNVDGFRYSAFITKERNGKIKIEPPWDWNRSFGNADYHGAWEVDSWYWHSLRQTEICWFERLQEDLEFMQRSIDRWFELRRSVFDLKRLHARVDELASRLAQAQERNYRRWPILGQQVTCNYFVGNTYAEEINWLKEWIARRTAWIDSQLPAPPKFKPDTFVPAPGSTLAFQPAHGEIYYTLDGTDPRAPGGKIAPGAHLFQKEITLLANSRIIARIKYSNMWSAPLSVSPKEMAMGNGKI